MKLQEVYVKSKLFFSTNKELLAGWLTRQKTFAKCTYCSVVNRLQFRDPTSFACLGFFNWETFVQWPKKTIVVFTALTVCAGSVVGCDVSS